jgi:hypothetical protein
MSKSCQIKNEEKDIVIRFDGELVGRNALARLLDFVELESIRRRSQLTEEDAAQLADEIDNRSGSVSGTSTPPRSTWLSLSLSTPISYALRCCANWRICHATSGNCFRTECYFPIALRLTCLARS